jgi:hypothetical protein
VNVLDEMMGKFPAEETKAKGREWLKRSRTKEKHKKNNNFHETFHVTFFVSLLVQTPFPFLSTRCGLRVQMKYIATQLLYTQLSRHKQIIQVYTHTNTQRERERKKSKSKARNS